MSDLATIELRGSPAAMGEAFGETFRDETRGLTESRIRHLIEFVERHAPGRSVSREAVLACVGQTVPAHESFDPAIWAEFRGIARAAGLSVEELLVGNGYTDLRDVVLFEGAAAGSPGEEGGCSAFAVPADLTRDGHPIVGQTWDMNETARPFVLVVRRKPADAPETLGLTTAGCLCLMGMNSEGVAVGNTNLVPTDARPGVHYLFTITRALRCGSAAEAADVIEAVPRASGHNYYAADEHTAVNLETTAARAHRTAVNGGVFVHTNHYLSDALRAVEFDGQDLRNSRWRYETLSGEFGRLSPPLETAACWRRLAAVTQEKVAEGNAVAQGIGTLAAIAMCPGEGELLCCPGGPDEAGATVLTL